MKSEAHGEKCSEMFFFIVVILSVTFAKYNEDVLAQSVPRARVSYFW
jgi:hypothetical protein